MQIEIRILRTGEEHVLSNIASGVFDKPIDKVLSSEFLADPRHHLAVALDKKLVVGFASAVHYIHPDKQPELWINEVAVAETHSNQGIAKQLLRALFDTGRDLGCKQAWVLTDRTNIRAMRLYASLNGTESDQTMFTFDL